MTTTLLLLVLAMPAATGPTVLPAKFEADLVRVMPQTRDGKTITFYTDSGGGLFLTDAAVKRLGLTPETQKAEGSEPAMDFVHLPAFEPNAAIPPPLANDGRIGVMPSAMAVKNGFTEDGMLGEAWFGGRVWTWDYPAGRLVLEGSGWKPDASATRVPIGLKKGETNFPRISIRVDGEAFDVLLDTGAMTTLKPDALATLGDKGPALRATSMIVDSRFSAWKKKHPDWRVIEAAQDKTNSAMIEVPLVEIGGANVGPVWFTWRPDKNFHDYMSGMMDGKVEGAIGGNALSHFVMTVDYPGGAAYFRCARDCSR
ncbi:MAG TPA: hypothetical protein VFV97_08905 [Rhodanobacteraceae bacterium]|nr:hypothetical protein [Rhodanobacteraceae bacterium]